MRFISEIAERLKIFNMVDELKANGLEEANAEMTAFLATKIPD